MGNNRVLIKNVHVWDGTSDALTEAINVLVSDDRLPHPSEPAG